MSTTLFPILQPQQAEERAELPLCRSIKFDFTTGLAVFCRGEPVIVEGLEAVLSWAWMALHTPRFRHAIFSWAYGCELESLIGQPYTEALKQAEGRRYVTECLTVSPYITSVDDITVDFADGVLSISCSISTVYGKKEVSANV